MGPSRVAGISPRPTFC